MAHINLLPWREELRSKRKRDFGIRTVVFALLTAAAVGLVHYQITRMIDRQDGRNQYLRAEIARMDKIIGEIKELEKTKERLLARMDVIQHLQGSRPQIVHLFDELVETIPEGVFLTKFSQQGSNLSLKGQAESNARVSAYMRNIESSNWIGKPKLVVIHSGKGRAVQEASTFDLDARQIDKSEEDRQ